MFEVFKNAWAIKDLRKKMLYTILLLFLFRVGSFIPVPGINGEVIENMINNTSFFKFFDSIAGGALSQVSIFAMSITPYITASIIMQLLKIAIPSIDKLFKEGGEGRKTINKYTKYMAIGLALIQSIGLYISFNFMQITNEAGETITALNNPNALTIVSIILSFTAGAALLIWLCDKITERGIGNGSSLIIFAGIVSSIPGAITTLWQRAQVDSSIYVWVLILLVAMILIIASIAFVQEAERRITVQYAKKVVGRKMYGGQSTHIPMKLALAGVIPIIFAMTLSSFPIQIMSFLNYNPEVGSIGYILKAYLFETNSIGYIIGYCLLIFGFTFFYTLITFNPVEVSNNLKKNGGFIPGIRSGKPTADYLQSILNRLTFVGSFFLMSVALIPYIAGVVFPFSISMAGTSLLIIVGVALETMKQLQSQMLVRNYKGFLG